LAAAALAGACSPSAAEPQVTLVPSPAARNLYTVNGRSGDVSLLSDTHARLRLAGGCLILDYDRRRFTPLFLPVGDPITLSATAITVYSRSFPLETDLSVPGLVPSTIELDRPNGCPRETIIVPSIEGTSKAPQ
jgi:hypothetical protein